MKTSFAIALLLGTITLKTQAVSLNHKETVSSDAPPDDILLQVGKKHHKRSHR